MANSTQIIEVNSSHDSTHESSGGMAPDVTLILLTWVTFFLLLAILHKFAWKPILTGLDQREDTIRKSLEDAERIKTEIEKIETTCVKLVDDAKNQADNIIVQSRKAAKDAAQIIENKAREEAKISLENALRDIKEESEKAQMQLRKESAQIAVELAGKLIKENIDNEKNQSLIEEYIKEI